MNNFGASSLDAIFQPAVLPCGRITQNRLVKVAMYEHLATFPGGPPNAHHLQLYSEWAKHDWGIVITGNVQIVPDHLTVGRDIVLPQALSSPTEESLLPFRRLAESIHGSYGESKSNNALAIMQLNHPGRQSSNFIGGRWPLQPPLAPSALRLGSGSGRKSGFIENMANMALFQTPKEMSEMDIHETMDRFVHGANFACKAGFDGIQLHVAHGYLLAQFLSPQTNKRKDAYSYDKALDIIRIIIERIRASTPKYFIISLKLNAADYTPSTSEVSLTENEQRALQHLLDIASWGNVDIVEISGGDYEKPDFMLASSESSELSTSKSPRQAFFARFSRQAVSALSSLTQKNSNQAPPLILLTGGLRTPALLRSALAHKHADLLGIGRAALLAPDIPSLLKEESHQEDIPFRPDPDLRPPTIFTHPPLSWVWNRVPNVKLIGAGVRMGWYVVALRRLAVVNLNTNTSEGNDQGSSPVEPDYTIGGVESVFRMYAWAVSPAAVFAASSDIPVRVRHNWMRYFSVVLLAVSLACLFVRA